MTAAAKVTPALVCAGLVSVALAGCGDLRGAGRPEATRALGAATITAVEKGQVQFVRGDMGGLGLQTLATNAVPWKVVTTALAREAGGRIDRPITGAEIRAIYRGFGFLTPERLANWAGQDQPSLKDPLGIVRGTVESRLPDLRIEVANITCAACHAGPTYDGGGKPQSAAWLGGSNTSIDFDAYARAIERGLRSALLDEEAFLRDVRTAYPDIDPRELRTIRVLVLPGVAARLSRVERWPGDDPLRYPAGGPGLTNAVGALKATLDRLDRSAPGEEAGFVQPPDLSNVVLRSSLVSDGSHGAPGAPRFREIARADVTDRHLDGLASVASTFLSGTMGLAPDKAARMTPRVREIFAALATLRPQPFPGRVDPGLARRGAEVYARECMACHGRYTGGIETPRLASFPNRLVPAAEIGTDRTRLGRVDPGFRQAVQSGPLGKRVILAHTAGYVAPRLDGVWASAPYLHNGSVPTLWHLMHPDERPARFEVGGHALDFRRVGIALGPASGGIARLAGHAGPASGRRVYDTTLPGRSNGGHEAEFTGLSEADRAALLEYLKLL